MKKLLTLAAAFVVALLIGSAWADAGDVININVFQDGTAISQDQQTLASDTVKIPSAAWLTLGQPGNGNKSVSGNTGFNLTSESVVTLSKSITASIHSEAGSNWADFKHNGADGYGDNAEYAYLSCWGSNRDRTCIVGWFKLENVPFESYDVILYFQGGTTMKDGSRGNITVGGSTPAGFDPIRVTSGNSAFTASHYYKPDENGVLSIDTGLSGSEADSNLSSDVITQASLWGQRAQSTSSYGVNATIVKDCAGTFEIHYWARTAAIAAVQVVDTTPVAKEVTVAGSEVTVSAINSAVSAAGGVAEDVCEVTLSEATSLAFDTAFVFSKAKIIRDGALKLLGNAAPTDWAKFNFDGVTSLDCEWLKGGSGMAINFNQGNGSLGDSEEAGIEGLTIYGNTWNNVGNNGSIDAKMFGADGVMVLADTMPVNFTGSAYQWTDATTPYLKGYLDDSNISFSTKVPFSPYDVYIICATDTANANFSYKTINGVNYSADEFGNAVPDSTAAWGASHQVSPILGQNVMRLTGLTSHNFEITKSLKVDGGRRGCIAAIVIVCTKDRTSQEVDAGGTYRVSDAAELGVDVVKVNFGEQGGELIIDETPTFDLNIITSGSLTITPDESIEITEAILRKISFVDCTGAIAWGFPVSRLTTSLGGSIYTAGTGDNPDILATVVYPVQNGQMTLKGREGVYYYLGDTAGANTSRVDFVDARVCAKGEMGFAVGMADFVLSGTTKVESEKVILSQGAAGRIANLTLNDTAEIMVTGTNVVDSNQSSIMFGHWNGPSTFTLNDEAKFTAESAQVLVGKTGNNQTININGGIFTTKGIKVSTGASGTNTLNLAGGNLKLGEYGITSYSKSYQMPIHVSGNVEITATDNFSITQPIEIDEGAVLTLDAGEYSITVAGAVENHGKMVLKGQSITLMTEAYNGDIDKEAAGEVRFGHVVNINDWGKVAIPEGLTAEEIVLFDEAGNEIEITRSDDNYLYYEQELTGGVCWWDYEFEGNDNNDGTDGARLSWDGGHPRTNAEYTEDGELYISSSPWRGSVSWPTTATFVMYGTMVGTDKTYQIGFGSTYQGQAPYNTIFLATDTVSKDTVNLCTCQAKNAPMVLCQMTVPNAQTAKHLYAFTLKTVDNKTVVDIYLDGELLQSYAFDSQIVLGTGFQIGSGHGGVCAGYNKAAAEDEAVLDFLRVYDVELSKEVLEGYAVEYPYVSPNGSYQRTITANANWSSTDAWTNEKTYENADQPAVGATVKLTVDAAALDAVTTVGVNLATDATYEAVQINGDDVKFARGEGDGLIRASGRVTANANVVFDYNAFSMAGAPLTVKQGKTVTFDLSMVDMSQYFKTQDYDLTGYLTLEEGAMITNSLPTELYGRTVSAKVNEETKHYIVTVSAPTYPFVYENGVWMWGEQTVDASVLADNPGATCVVKSDLSMALGACNYIVEAGATLTQTDASATGVITVNAGGTFDVNGVIDTSLKVVLNGGSLVNTGSAVPVSKKQYVSLSQTASSFVGGTNELAYVCSGYAANTFDLSGAILTKKDDNTFTLRTTTITNGTIAVTGGTLVLENCTIAAGEPVTLDIADGATVDIRGSFTKDGTLNITGAGTVICNVAVPAFNNMEGWTGTVYLKSGVQSPLNIGSYATDESQVKVSNFAGHLQANTIQNAALELENINNVAAMKITDSSKGNVYKFIKPLTGTGTFEFETTAGSNCAAAFADVSNFSGAIISGNRPITLGTVDGVTAGTDSIITVTDGATIGCWLEAKSIVLGNTIKIKGYEVNEFIATGLTNEPANLANVKVILLDEAGNETGRGALKYIAEEIEGEEIGYLQIVSGSGFLIMLK